MADTWTEYLCAELSERGFELGIFANEVICCIPPEWFDDDGEPLPEYQDENGELLIPSEYEAQPIEAHDGEYLFGPLRAVNDLQSSRFHQLTVDAVSEALLEIEWLSNDADEVLAALILLQSAAAPDGKGLADDC